MCQSVAKAPPHACGYCCKLRNLLKIHYHRVTAKNVANRSNKFLRTVTPSGKRKTTAIQLPIAAKPNSSKAKSKCTVVKSATDRKGSGYAIKSCSVRLTPIGARKDCELGNLHCNQNERMPNLKTGEKLTFTKPHGNKISIDKPKSTKIKTTKKSMSSKPDSVKIKSSIHPDSGESVKRKSKAVPGSVLDSDWDILKAFSQSIKTKLQIPTSDNTTCINVTKKAALLHETSANCSQSKTVSRVKRDANKHSNIREASPGFFRDTRSGKTKTTGLVDATKSSKRSGIGSVPATRSGKTKTVCLVDASKSSKVSKIGQVDVNNSSKVSEMGPKEATKSNKVSEESPVTQMSGKNSQIKSEAADHFGCVSAKPEQPICHIASFESTVSGRGGTAKNDGIMTGDSVTACSGDVTMDNDFDCDDVAGGDDAMGFDDEDDRTFTFGSFDYIDTNTVNHVTADSERAAVDNNITTSDNDTANFNNEIVTVDNDITIADVNELIDTFVLTNQESHKLDVKSEPPVNESNSQCERDRNQYSGSGAPFGALKTPIDNKPEPYTTYFCDYCGMQCDNEQHFRIHMEKHTTPSETFACSICEKRFGRKQHLRLHIRRVHTDNRNQRVYLCSQCSYSAKSITGLHNHMLWRHTKGKTFKCSYCDHWETLNGLLHYHVRTEHPEKCIAIPEDGIYSCKHCDQAFNRHFSLQKHMYKKHGIVNNDVLAYTPATKKRIEKKKLKTKLLKTRDPFNYPVKCPEPGCTMRCRNKYLMKEHIKFIHTDQRPFVCEFCNLAFKQKQVLKNHIKRKHKEYAHMCLVECPHPDCHMTFEGKQSLNAHIRSTHNSSMPFKCPLCSRKFKHVKRMNNHVETKHGQSVPLVSAKSENFIGSRDPDIYPFECPEAGCPMRFQKRFQLTQHTKHVHSSERPYKCEYCEGAFKVKHVWQTHVRKQHNKIPTCEEDGKIQRDPINHPFECAVQPCTMRFKTKNLLKAHITRIHSDERKFACEVCNSAFKFRHQLQNHIKVNHKQPNQSEAHIENIKTETKQNVKPDSSFESPLHEFNIVNIVPNLSSN